MIPIPKHAEWSGPADAEPCVNVDPEVRALTSAIAAGDTAAFGRFFDEWFGAMCAEAARSTGRDEAFCLDVVQDAMMRVIRSLRPMDTADDLRRWVRVVVRSCAYDRLRSEARRTAREGERSGRDAAADRSDDLGPRLEWLRRELASLDDRSLDLLIMRHRFGWTLRRIGETLGIGPGAVDGRLRRIVAALRRKRGEAGDD